MDIKKGNQDFLNILENNKELKDRRDELVKGQHPDTLIITCSDSRVVPEYIFNASLGELFVIRTAGNVINEGELATVEYAIEHLKVKRIIVLGHTHCGAIHAAINNEHGMYLDPILNRIKTNISIIHIRKHPMFRYRTSLIQLCPYSQGTYFLDIQLHQWSSF